MAENLLPEGRYKARVHDWATGASAAKGTPYVKLGFKIVEGEHKDRIIDWFGWVTDKTMPRLATDLCAVGYEGEDPLVDFARAKSHADVPGTLRDVQVVVRHEEFPQGSGRLNARVAFINELAQAAPIDDASKAAMKAAFAEARRGKQRAPTPTPIDDAGDVPFLGEPMKPCIRCRRTLPLSDFYAHPRMADGHLNKCKSCQKEDVRAARKRAGGRKEYERERQQRPERKAAKTAYAKRARQRAPEKFKARAAVRSAIVRGALSRIPCEVCGDPKSEAHHDDYSKPLAVRWLCLRHHREIGHGQAETMPPF